MTCSSEAVANIDKFIMVSIWKKGFTKVKQVQISLYESIFKVLH